MQTDVVCVGHSSWWVSTWQALLLLNAVPTFPLLYFLLCLLIGRIAFKGCKIMSRSQFLPQLLINITSADPPESTTVLNICLLLITSMWHRSSSRRTKQGKINDLQVAGKSLKKGMGLTPGYTTRQPKPEQALLVQTLTDA